MKAAVYESDITPPLGCYMTGYGRDRRAKEVYSKLHAKSLVIEQNGKYAVVISVDICEYPSEMPEIVTKRIEEYTGIKPECVCIHSTHAHCGAPVTDNPNINCFADPEYKHVLMLFYFEDFGIEEIARILKKTKKNTSVLLHRARNALKNQLIKENFMYEIR